MRLVLDTAVMVAALRSASGASRELVLAALDERCTMVVSVPLFIEYEAVMTRPEHLAAAGVTAEDVGVVLDALAGVVAPVQLTYLWRPTLRDPNDDMVLETALNGGAQAVVTFNARDFKPAARFGVQIWSPGEALTRMRTT